MELSIFTDELGLDLEQAIPVVKGWGLNAAPAKHRKITISKAPPGTTQRHSPANVPGSTPWTA